MDRLEKLKEFLKNSPSDSFLQHALALEYVKLGDDKAGGNIFENLLTIDPGYVGSYYHYAALLVRSGDTEKAIALYERGMEEAKKAGDGHALNELRAAYEDLVY